MHTALLIRMKYSMIISKTIQHEEERVKATFRNFASIQRCQNLDKELAAVAVQLLSSNLRFTGIILNVLQLHQSTTNSRLTIVLLRTQSVVDAYSCFIIFLYKLIGSRINTGSYTLDMIFCYVWFGESLFWLGIVFSVQNLVCISFDRFYAVCFPSQYKLHQTKLIITCYLYEVALALFLYIPSFFTRRFVMNTCEAQFAFNGITIEQFFQVRSFLWLIFNYLLPAFIMIGSHAYVIHLVRHQAPNQQGSPHVRNNVKRLILTTAMMAGLILVLHSYEAIRYVLGNSNVIPFAAFSAEQQVGTLLITLSAVLNPCVLIAMSHTVRRQAIRSVLRYDVLKDSTSVTVVLDCLTIVLLRTQSVVDAYSCFIIFLYKLIGSSVNTGSYTLDMIFCYVWFGESLFWLGIVFSVQNLVCISFDRFYAVCFPSQYKLHQTKLIITCYLYEVALALFLYIPSFFTRRFVMNTCEAQFAFNGITIEQFFQVRSFLWLIFNYLLPAFIMIGSHAYVIHLVRHQAPNQQGSPHVRNNVKRLILTTAMMAGLILVLHSYEAIRYVLGNSNVIPFAAFSAEQQVGTLLITLSAVLNPCVLIAMSHTVRRQAIRSVLRYDVLKDSTSVTVSVAHNRIRDETVMHYSLRPRARPSSCSRASQTIGSSAPERVDKKTAVRCLAGHTFESNAQGDVNTQAVRLSSFGSHLIGRFGVDTRRITNAELVLELYVDHDIFSCTQSPVRLDDSTVIVNRNSAEIAEFRSSFSLVVGTFNKRDMVPKLLAYPVSLTLDENRMGCLLDA
ncbi:amine GPCR, partial [Clonorchis sinensis]